MFHARKCRQKFFLSRHTFLYHIDIIYLTCLGKKRCKISLFSRFVIGISCMAYKALPSISQTYYFTLEQLKQLHPNFFHVRHTDVWMPIALKDTIQYPEILGDRCFMVKAGGICQQCSLLMIDVGKEMKRSPCCEKKNENHTNISNICFVFLVSACFLNMSNQATIDFYTKVFKVMCLYDVHFFCKRILHILYVLMQYIHVCF